MNASGRTAIASIGGVVIHGRIPGTARNFLQFGFQNRCLGGLFGSRRRIVNRVQCPLSLHNSASYSFSTTDSRKAFYSSNVVACSSSEPYHCTSPKPKRIILMRHGQSLANLDKSIHTHTPDYKISLTKTGRMQAYEAGRNLARIIPPEESIKFWVSPYYRTRETFEEVLRSFKHYRKVTYCEEIRLREQEWGNFQNEEEIRRVAEERWRYGPFYYRFPNGESGCDVYDRVSAFLETLYRSFGREDNMILISHGLTCRLFLMRWFKWPVKLFHRLENLENAQTVLMELQPDGKYRIKTALMLRQNSEVGFSPEDFHSDVWDKIQLQKNSEDILFNDDPEDDGPYYNLHANPNYFHDATNAEPASKLEKGNTASSSTSGAPTQKETKKEPIYEWL